jgi:hypothetical protein
VVELADIDAARSKVRGFLAELGQSERIYNDTGLYEGSAVLKQTYAARTI